MPLKSLSMRSARFLNREKVITKLSKLSAKACRQDKRIKRIILFGSLADGSFTGTSDADLLIVLTESSARFIDRIPVYLMHFRDAPVDIDVFPYTEEEIAHIPLARKALSQGIVLSG
jgi:predicted nucleotidyltransferase